MHDECCEVLCLKVLLVRPNYPDSRNSVYRIPIGLLKLSSYHKSKGDIVKYVEGYDFCEDFLPDIVQITGMFTYWSQITIDTINYYKKKFPEAKVITGGIYPSIAPEHVKSNSLVDEVIIGVIPEVEKCLPDYSLLATDTPEINETQIIWTSRGCKFRCSWCYTHVIEPDIYFKSIEEIEKELYANTKRTTVILFDNSFMQYPDIKRLLWMFKHFHKKYGYIYSACQGIDCRILKQHEDNGIPIAKMMKEAGFYDLRFSWDHEGQREPAKYALEKFEQAGFKRNEIQMFVIINSNDPPELIERRYFEIYQLGTQIHSDRYRPGDIYYDNYHKGGTDYFINTEHDWDDMKIRGLLSFMSTINYSVRMGCLYAEAERIMKSKDLNKGKSSKKLDTF